jgi:hypothetical protein
MYAVAEIEVAIKALQSMQEGLWIPDGMDDVAATKLAAATVSAALSIISTGLGEIIAEHERSNNQN